MGFRLQRDTTVRVKDEWTLVQEDNVENRRIDSRFKAKSVWQKQLTRSKLLCCLDRRFNLAIQASLRRYFILLENRYTGAGSDDIGRCLRISPTRIWLVNR